MTGGLRNIRGDDELRFSAPGVLTLTAISELKRKEQDLSDFCNVVWVVDLCESRA